MSWTPYQLKVIEALKRGEKLHYITGINAHWFIGNLKPRPSDKTIEKLKRGNMIVCGHADWRGSWWKLTPPATTEG